MVKDFSTWLNLVLGDLNVKIHPILQVDNRFDALFSSVSSSTKFPNQSSTPKKSYFIHVLDFHLREIASDLFP